jgi:DNA polymerase-3 subunit gamma/tau
MAQILPLQLRPKGLSGLLGQKPMVSAIRAQMKKREPQAWMFQGPPGTGKTTTARILALSYQCSPQHQTRFGEPCTSCLYILLGTLVGVYDPRN